MKGTVLNLLGKCVNRPFKDDGEHLAFHFINIKNQKSCLAMTFDHRLFDARGAENFLGLFQQYLQSDNGPAISAGVPSAAPAYLRNGQRNFLPAEMSPAR